MRERHASIRSLQTKSPAGAGLFIKRNLEELRENGPALGVQAAFGILATKASNGL